MATIEEIEVKLQRREQQILIESIEAQLSAREVELAKTETPTPFFDEVGRSFMNNALSVLNLGGQVLSQGVAGTEAALEGGASVLTGGDFDFERRANRNMQFPPFSQLNAIPSPTINEVGAFVRELPESVANLPLLMGRQVRSGSDLLPDVTPVPDSPRQPFSERFDETLANLNREQARVAEKFPKATFAGDIGGDVASIFTGRLPFLSKIDKAEAFLAGRKFAAAIKNPGAAGELGNIARGLLDSKAMRSLMRGAGRAGEAGLEAAILEALDGDDPLKAAAYVAGGQAFGSTLLALSHGVRSGGIIKAGLKFATLGAAYTGVIQMTKSTVPGGKNSLLESGEEAFFHLAMLMLAGGVATVAGAGRLRGTNFDKKFPRVSETLSTLPRATMIAWATDYINATPDEQKTIDKILNQLQQDPEFFGPEITERLLKAMESGNLTKALRDVPAQRESKQLPSPKELFR